MRNEDAPRAEVPAAHACAWGVRHRGTENTFEIRLGVSVPQCVVITD